jgi:hypothetical protein
MLNLDREAQMQRAGRWAKGAIVGGTITIIAAVLLWNNRHNLRRRTIDPDWYAFIPSHLSH